MAVKGYNEADVRVGFRKLWDGWIDTIQPGLGGTTGIPDTQVLIDGYLVPIELKWGEMKVDVIVPKKIRPDQISWHRRFANAGGRSFFIIGVSESMLFLVGAKTAISLRHNGIPIGCCCILNVSKKDFSSSLRGFVRSHRHAP